jgi:hypothetical protein
VTASLLEQLADLPKAEVDALIRAMAPGEANAFEHDWRYRARPEQLAPVGSWRVWLLMAGRGFGTGFPGWTAQTAVPTSTRSSSGLSLQPQFASKRPLLSHMDITGRRTGGPESTLCGHSALHFERLFLPHSRPKPIHCEVTGLGGKAVSRPHAFGRSRCAGSRLRFTMVEPDLLPHFNRGGVGGGASNDSCCAGQD